MAPYIEFQEDLWPRMCHITISLYDGDGVHCEFKTKTSYKDLRLWCSNNINYGDYGRTSNAEFVWFDFKHEADAVAFKLQFGGE